ncbi:pre-mRNA-processing ATP-dependent RNA helicase PRP5-like [Pyrus ussuriensis x Pyrus communis]|uniref:Pre-mRNA-processing ATP-dependent RNA helicase PRP5-like n=1 Tax=Pyrus ussuriensis x Pyrus communis TaxID=2448454 RepID=A0A5N5H7B6_9ROSA|nr:pre-mRNA-processing ATP-dependent RNA helicase PRP5-like [Pyrus ussuriensis x Pyrus communis]
MWTTPTPPFFKINVDDTWMAPLQAKVSIIFRDSDGLLIGGKAKSLVQASSEEIEAEAKLARMKLAHKHHIDHAIIESDSKVVIHTLSNLMCKGSWPIFPIVNMIPIPSPSLVMVLPRDGLPCLLLDEF